LVSWPSTLSAVPEGGVCLWFASGRHMYVTSYRSVSVSQSLVPCSLCSFSLSWDCES
jgi:hypothetical protein